MTHLNPILPAALALLLASPVLAQETTTTETATAEDTAPAADAADGETTEPVAGLSMGEEVSDEPKLGDTYITETIGDWSVQCVVSEADPDPCQLYQLMNDTEGQPMAEVSLFRLPKGGQAVAGALVAVPLETLLTSQVTVSVDGGKAKRYPFSFCNLVGCYSRIGLTEADINAFRRGNKAMISVVPVAAPDQQVRIEMSLKGFTDSYKKASIISN